MPYRPSERVKRFKQGYKLSANRVAWARIAWGTVSMMKYPDNEVTEEQPEEGVQPEALTEPGPTIRLVISKNTSSRPITLDLTMLTAEELESLHKLLNLACEAAKPVCQLRDEEVARQHAEGDDSNHRVYRPVSQFVVREGADVEHLESLRDRLAVTVERVKYRDGVGRDLRTGKHGMAEQVPQLDQPQDDKP